MSQFIYLLSKCKLIATILLGTFILTGCTSDMLFVSKHKDDNNFVVIPVTPDIIFQLRQEQFDKYNSIHRPQLLKLSEYNYRFGIGDVISIKIKTAFSQENQLISANWKEFDDLQVDNEGNITLPYIGEVSLIDKTPQEAKQLLKHSFQKYFKDPEPLISIKEFKGRSIQITGEIHKPGEYHLHYEPLHLLEAINIAGGLLDNADLENAVITHKDGTMEDINLYALINYGNSSQNQIMYDKDMLYIPANYGNKVYVMGELNQPTMQTIKAGKMSAMEALNASAGINTTSGATSQIYIIRGAIKNTSNTTHNDNKTIVFHYNTLQTKIYQLDGSYGKGLAIAAQFPLQPNDVVYVSTKPITEWNRFITQLLPGNINNNPVRSW